MSGVNILGTIQLYFLQDVAITIVAAMRDINLGTCATTVGTTTASTPLPQAMLRFAFATEQVQGIYVFQHCLGEGGRLGVGNGGIGSV